jgi:hypothetical protein
MLSEMLSAVWFEEKDVTVTMLSVNLASGVAGWGGEDVA